MAANAAQQQEICYNKSLFAIRQQSELLLL